MATKSGGISHEEFLAANRRMEKLRATKPMVTAAHYDPASNNVMLNLSTGIGIFFPPHDAQGPEDATPAQLSDIEINSSGFGLHFPQLDADLYVPALLDGILGSRKWMAARLGAEGGKARSLAKRTAARANGSLGGRPRKSAAR